MTDEARKQFLMEWSRDGISGIIGAYLSLQGRTRLNPAEWTQLCHEVTKHWVPGDEDDAIGALRRAVGT